MENEDKLLIKFVQNIIKNSEKGNLIYKYNLEKKGILSSQTEISPNDIKQYNKPIPIFKVNKSQLLSSRLKESIEKGYFSKYNDFIFQCSDADLFFDEKETKLLLENYESMLQSKSDLYFEETISGQYYYDNTKGKLKEYYPVSKQVLRSLAEIIEVNKKLSIVANKINKLDNQLSPFEKYLLCYKIVSNIEYYFCGGKNDSTQSFVDTVKFNKGCCVGKSQYLRALLYMVGINACNIKINCDREDIIRLGDNIKNGITGFIEIGSLGKTFSFEKGIKALNKQVSSGNNPYITDHEINLVGLIDDKYGIYGVFMADAHKKMFWNDCYCSFKGNIETLFNFSSLYLSADDICKFLDRFDCESDKKLNEKQKEKILKEYLKIGKQLLYKDLDELDDSKTKEIPEDEHKHIEKALKAFDAHIKLEEAPLAEAIPFTTLQKAQEKVDEIYEKYFSKESEEEKIM